MDDDVLEENPDNGCAFRVVDGAKVRGFLREELAGLGAEVLIPLPLMFRSCRYSKGSISTFDGQDLDSGKAC